MKKNEIRIGSIVQSKDDGEIGRVVDVDHEEHTATVLFDRGEDCYERYVAVQDDMALVGTSYRAERFADYDDCLDAACGRASLEYDLPAWQLTARWDSDQRNHIVVMF